MKKCYDKTSIIDFRAIWTNLSCNSYFDENTLNVSEEDTNGTNT